MNIRFLIGIISFFIERICEVENYLIWKGSKDVLIEIYILGKEI